MNRDRDFQYDVLNFPDFKLDLESYEPRNGIFPHHFILGLAIQNASISDVNSTEGMRQLNEELCCAMHELGYGEDDLGIMGWIKGRYVDNQDYSNAPF